MEKLLDFIERHKYGILITLIAHVAIFLYFQIATYKEATLYEPWKFRTIDNEAPDDIEISPDQIETLEEQILFNQSEKITSFVKDENDTRERSKEDNIKYTSYAKNGNVEQMEDDYEQEIKDKIRKEREEKMKAEGPSDTDLEKEKVKKDKTKGKQGGKASEKAVDGATLVSFSLNNRHPLNHNDWYVRNPGYTCGNVSGLVKVAIVVDEGGNVINASIIEEQSQNVSACMRDKAKQYALMSRFNYDAKAAKKQEGTITYRFVYK